MSAIHLQILQYEVIYSPATLEQHKKFALSCGDGNATFCNELEAVLLYMEVNSLGPGSLVNGALVAQLGHTGAYLGNQRRSTADHNSSLTASRLDRVSYILRDVGPGG